MMLGQGRSDPKDVPVITAVILCKSPFLPSFYLYPFVTLTPLQHKTKEHQVFQILGGAFGVSGAEAAFSNQLLRKLPISAPGVNPALVLATGASELRNVFTADQLPGVLEAYMTGIKAAFAVAIAMMGLGVPVSLLSKWDKLDAHKEGGAGMAV